MCAFFCVFSCALRWASSPSKEFSQISKILILSALIGRDWGMAAYRAEKVEEEDYWTNKIFFFPGHSLSADKELVRRACKQLLCHRCKSDSLMLPAI
jgi:hypothetical protein